MTTHLSNLLVVMLVTLLFVSIIGFVFFPWLISASPFPQPTGQWQVGTSELLWNRDRISPSDPAVISKVWYPTNSQNGMNSPYLERMGRTFSPKITLNLFYSLIFSKFLLGRVAATPALVNAAPCQSLGGFPLVLFSPGLTGINSLNTFYALEFASHGFIVVGINHPGSSASTMLTDGSQIGITQEVLDAFSNPDLMISKLAIDQADNISLVLEQVINLNYTVDSLLYQKINVNKIFAAGHSFGGSASFLACCQDQRISRSVNFDGYFFIDEIDIDRVASQDENRRPKDFLLILSDRPIPKKSKPPNKFDLMMAKDQEKIAKLADNKNFNTILISAASHVNFSDLPLLLKPVFSKVLRLFSGTDGRETLAKTSTMAIDFLNR
jgi:dienelactone hydrolase